MTNVEWCEMKVNHGDTEAQRRRERGFWEDVT